MFLGVSTEEMLVGSMKSGISAIIASQISAVAVNNRVIVRAINDLLIDVLNM